MKVKVDFCESDCTNCNRFCIREENFSLVPVKKKVARHYIPPDMTAIKMLTESQAKDDVENMTDEELKAEILKLLGKRKLDKINL